MTVTLVGILLIAAFVITIVLMTLKRLAMEVGFVLIVILIALLLGAFGLKM